MTGLELQFDLTVEGQLPLTLAVRDNTTLAPSTLAA